MEYKPQKRGPKIGSQRPAPREPEKVLQIVRLRDNQKLRWRTIGNMIGETHQGPYLLYKRWQEWAKEQMK